MIVSIIKLRKHGAFAVGTAMLLLLFAHGSNAGELDGFGYPRTLGIDTTDNLFLLGPAQTALAVLLSFWLGTIVALLLLILKKKGRTFHIPFAPFLSPGAFISWLWGERLIAWYFGLF